MMLLKKIFLMLSTYGLCYAMQQQDIQFTSLPDSIQVILPNSVQRNTWRNEPLSTKGNIRNWASKNMEEEIAAYYKKLDQEVITESENKIKINRENTFDNFFDNLMPIVDVLEQGQSPLWINKFLVSALLQPIFKIKLNDRNIKRKISEDTYQKLEVHFKQALVERKIFLRETLVKQHLFVLRTLYAQQEELKK